MLQVIDTDREVVCKFPLSEGHLPALTGKAPVGITPLPYNRRSKAIRSILLDVTELSLKLQMNYRTCVWRTTQNGAD